MNMTVLFKKYTYGLLLIATTLIGCAFNFTSAGSITYNGTVNFTRPSGANTTRYNLFRLNVPLKQVYNTTTDNYINSINCTFSNISLPSGITYTQFQTRQNISYNTTSQFMSQTEQTYVNYNGNGTYNFPIGNNKIGNLTFIDFLISFESSNPVGNFNLDYSCTIEGDGIIGTTSNSCSPSGQCTVSNKITENIIESDTKNFSNAGYTNMFNYGNNGAGTYCLKFTSSNAQQLTMGFANGGTTAPTNLYTLYADQYGNRICLYGNKPYFNIKLNAGSNSITYDVYKLTDLLSDDIPCTQQNCQTCEEQYTSTECQEKYDLKPIEDIDQEYCINANLCPILQGSGDVQWSALYINNVQHLGNDIINIDIPEEIERDYYYNSGETNVEIVGYGYDQEKMQSMVNTQFTPPSAEDMENIIGKVADFLPLVAIMLLIVYAWWLIKKVF